MEASMRSLVLSLILLVGCKGGEESLVECPDDSFVTYENFGEPLMLTWCTPCHSSHLSTPEERQDATDGVNLDSYDDVVKHTDLIQLFAVETDAMPPAGGPDVEERDLLAEWIACGMPE
jgi:uncharacterized membrane protein